MQELLEFILKVEKSSFRTGHDTGANPCALSVWNQLREYAGLSRLTQYDLMMRHAVDMGWTEEEAFEDYAQMERYREWSNLRTAESRVNHVKSNGDLEDEFDWDAKPQPRHYKIRKPDGTSTN